MKPRRPIFAFATSLFIAIRASAAPFILIDPGIPPCGVTPSSSDEAVILQSAPGVEQIIAQRGQPAPGTSSTFNFASDIDNGVFDWVASNGTGHVAFRAFLAGSDTNETNEKAIFAGTASTLHLIARAGDPAPGPSSLQFGSVYSLAINAHDQVILRANLYSFNPPVFTEGVFVGSPGNFKSLNQPRPGLTLSNIVEGQLNDSGQLSFVADSNTGTTAVWFGTYDALHPLVSLGDAAPGLASGYQFTRFGATALDALGEVGFEATAANPLIANSGVSGLWAADSSGQIHFIGRDGDILTTPDGLRTSTALRFYPDGADFSRLAFNARFDDGPYALYNYAVVLPEPAIITSLLPTTLLISRRRRHAR